MLAWLLKRYEEGYTLINDKRAQQFATFYGVDPQVFYDDPLIYNTAIVTTSDSKPKKTSNFRNKVDDFLSNIKVFWTLLAAFVLSLAGLGTSIYFYVESNDRPYTFLTSDIRAVHEDVATRGSEGSTLPLLYTFMYATTFRQLDIDYPNDEQFSITIPDNAAYYGTIAFSYTHPYAQGTEEGSMETLRIMFSAGNTAIFDYSNDEDPTSMGVGINGYYIDGKFVASNNNATEEQIAKAEAVHPLFIEKADEYISSLGLNETFSGFIQVATSSANNVGNILRTSLLTTFLTALLTLVLLSLVIYSGLKVYSIRKKAKLELFEGENLDEFEGIATENKPLPKNKPSFLFLKEGYLKIILLTFLILGMNTVLLRLLSFLQPEMPIFTSGYYEDYKTAAQVILYLTIFAVFFVKIDALTTRKNILLSIYIILFYGFAFYLVEVLLYRLFSMSTIFGAMLSGFFPGNIFLGMASILVFAYFLIYLPKWVNKPWKQILFRLGTLIPIAYLVASIAVSYLDTMGEISINFYVRFLLQTQSIEACLFCILAICFLAVYRYISYKIYGKEGAHKIVKGTVYYTARNIFLCLVLVVFTLLGWFVEDSFYGLQSLNLENDRYLCCLIPFILLYQPRIPKTNIKQDIWFNIGYVGLYALPYVLSAIIVIAG